MEFVVMLGLLTVLGLFIMKSFIGSKGNGGAVNTAVQNGVPKIAYDKD